MNRKQGDEMKFSLEERLEKQKMDLSHTPCCAIKWG